MDSVMRSLKVLQGLFLLKKITWIEASEKYWRESVQLNIHFDHTCATSCIHPSWSTLKTSSFLDVTHIVSAVSWTSILTAVPIYTRCLTSWMKTENRKKIVKSLHFFRTWCIFLLGSYKRNLQFQFCIRIFSCIKNSIAMHLSIWRQNLKIWRIILLYRKGILRYKVYFTDHKSLFRAI